MAMDRLPFSLHDFVRVSWTSDGARDVWQPRLRQIAAAWSDLEFYSVVARLRRCCIAFVAPDHLVSRASQWARQGLTSLPVGLQGASAAYCGGTPSVEFGRPFMYRIAVGEHEDILEFLQAYEASNEMELGQLLGYPRCCTEFFLRHWVEEKLTDTTWAMALQTPGAEADGKCLTVRSTPTSNSLWRWIGIRAVPHLPCCFACESTDRLGTDLMSLGRERGMREEMNWLDEVLSWPVEWSALHGIAEIKTPILKVTTRTDATGAKYVVRTRASMYPAEGARGITFPYLACTGSSGKDKSAGLIASQLRSQPSWYASDNDFTSSTAMDTAHAPIVRLAATTLQKFTSSAAVIDFGCGNGVLLKKIRDLGKDYVPFGIDSQPGRIEHAREIHADYEHNFIAGDMFASETLWPPGRRYSLAIIMVGRLLEATDERREALRDRLRSHCETILLYAYADTLLSYKSNLLELAARAGFALLEWREGATAAIGTLAQREQLTGGCDGRC